ncbi:MAG: hypothetical protein LBG96_12235, partial [Tannerella sp.]|nr:hypothetical protein [Tannerella sp.]
MGKSCTNESARILATRAGMTGVPCFEKRFDLTHAGILPTIPALSTCGLLKHTGRFAGVTGYYTTEQVFIVLGFLALLISPEVRKSEGHICICFTAYTVLLELERMLKKAKSDITVKRAQELTKN